MKKGVFCVLVCMLMMFTTVALVSANTLSKTTSHPQIMGNILYVGGTGPNNYTKIQDAVNDSFDGDTVFVYADSSPYYEKIIIEKSITLTGEDSKTTVIYGGAHRNASVLLQADGITVQRFTIGHSFQGIRIESNNNIIKENIITATTEGIYLFKACVNKIEDNIFSNNSWGIYDSSIGGNVISGNIITCNSADGILLGSSGTVVSFNTISENGQDGISVYGDNNIIQLNNIIDNQVFGVGIWNSKKNSILQNNIYNNQKGDANMAVDLWMILPERPFDHTWDENYWGRPYQFSKVVLGMKFLILPSLILQWFLYNVLQKQHTVPAATIYIPVLKFDWHPAQEPYDILEVYSEE
ncbi:MAG: right-handed parallel beta-helix repeat-containing protein [Candidatus Thermoplasmatota archaeon]|nr:right-handed parallel beta-helix repeat-containing protein [Candidatus Thermoplasmatota archaeon]